MVLCKRIEKNVELLCLKSLLRILYVKALFGQDLNDILTLFSKVLCDLIDLKLGIYCHIVTLPFFGVYGTVSGFLEAIYIEPSPSDAKSNFRMPSAIP